MRTIEYRRWSPPGSPVRIEFPAELLLELGWAETSGVLYGSRRHQEIRIAAIGMPWGEEQEKIGVFVSRIRGEVFLTEKDLAFFKEHQGEIALVVAGDRGGFFVREADGSIQTVRSHEEFPIARPRAESAPGAAAAPKAIRKTVERVRKWMPAGVPAWIVALAALPLAALAVFPQRVADKPLELRVHEAGGQLRITWKPGENAVLAIDDDGRRLAIPVYANQSNVTYAPRGSQVEVSLVTVDAANQPRRESAIYIVSTGPSREP